MASGLVHTPYRQVFANEASRIADFAVYNAGDLYKKAYQADTGAEYVLASLAPTVWAQVGGPSRINWRGGVAGQVYNTANPALGGDILAGDTVMVLSGPSTVVGVTFPQANAASAGRDIAVIDTIDKEGGDDSGTVRYTPFLGDNFASWPDNQVLDAATTGNAIQQIRLWRSDGNGTWWCIGNGGNSTGDFSEFP